MNTTYPDAVLVMVVDDQFGAPDDNKSRRWIYDKWFAQLGEFHKGKWAFEVHYCNDLRTASNINCAAGRPRLAIVDMVLDALPWTDSTVDHLDTALTDDKWPMILVSAKFDSKPAIQRANKLVGRADATVSCQFLTWSSICRAVDGYDSDEVAFIVGAVLSRARNQDLQFKKAPEEPISILHITDPHFGRASWNVGALISLRVFFEAHGLLPADFLAITGDIADRGIPSQYEAAAEYFEALATHEIVVRTDVGLPNDRVLVCPGNHDFAWPLALAANISKEPPFALSPALTNENIWARAFSLGPYEEFEAKITNRAQRWISDPGFRINTRFSTSGLIFLELNVEQFTITGYAGGITPNDLKKSIKAAATKMVELRKNRECLVVLMHRFESNLWNELSQVIESDLKGLAMAGPLVLMCGHEHQPRFSSEMEDRALVIRGQPAIPGPTLPQRVLPIINYIRLWREEGRISAVEVHQFHEQATTWLKASEQDWPKQFNYQGNKWQLRVNAAKP